MNTLHAAFFEDQIKQINLFVVGIGNVGGKLLEQIKLQADYLLKKQHLQLRIVAISNSRKMLFQSEGINLADWSSQLDQIGEKADLEGLSNK